MVKAWVMYQIKITLNATKKTACMATFDNPHTIALNELHQVIQIAM